MTSDTAKSPSKMQYIRLGNTGMKVSKICLGCMSYGSSKWQPWVLDEAESLEILKKAYDAGINFFDTANVYSSGESEKVLGNAIKKFGFQRSKIVVATKVFSPFIEGKPEVIIFGKDFHEYGLVNQNGLSRKHIFEALDASLRRLQLDYVDLYQIHRFDPNTPIEETMEALHDLVKSGKVRYIGASSMYAWQFQKMNHVAEKNGWTKFVTMQNMYNAIYREEEREIVPYCLDAGIGMIPWGPLAAGALTRPATETTFRNDTSKINVFARNRSEVDDAIINRVCEIANKKNITPAQVATAWVLSKPVVSAPIVGISKEQNLNDILGALDVKLTEEEIKYIEELYMPKPIAGHQ